MRNPIGSESLSFYLYTHVFQAGRLLLNESDFSALQNNFLLYKTLGVHLLDLIGFLTEYCVAWPVHLSLVYVGIWIGNLPFSIKTEMDVKPHFPDAESISVPVHQDTGKIKGFGYVTYATVEQAQAAVKAAENLEIDGRMIRVVSLQRPTPMAWGCAVPAVPALPAYVLYGLNI